MKAPLEIALFGSSLVSAYWNGAVTYYRGIVRALAARGHRVTFYEPDVLERQQHRDIPDPPWAEVVVYSGTLVDDVHRVLERARRADVIIKASGVGAFDALLDREVPHAVKPGAISALWELDSPATIERLRSNPADPFRALVPRYHIVFTNGGGPAVVRGYVELGARLCVPIYNAVDPATHFPVSAEPHWFADLSLLTNRSPDREARVGELFLRPASLLPQKTFLLGGNGWEGRGVPPNVRAIGHVYTSDHNAFNASARCVLNVTRDSMAANGWSPTTRVFEAAGAGACVISDAWEGLEIFLEPGREVLVAQDGEDVARILRDMTAVRAREIGAAARARVLAHHTYAQRAKLVDSILATNAPATEAAP
jgi:spore maturation protein CgeB